MADTVTLVRHGATDHSIAKRFSGGVTGANPPLSDLGIAQVEATADWLADRGGIDVLVTSPVRRTRESAAIVSARLGLQVSEVVDGVAEMDFGSWEGLTFGELHEQHPDDLGAWLADHDVPAGGGESFRHCAGQYSTTADHYRYIAIQRKESVISHSLDSSRPPRRNRDDQPSTASAR